MRRSGIIWDLFINAVGDDGSCDGNPSTYGEGPDGKESCTGKVVAGDVLRGQRVKVVWTGWRSGIGGIDLSLRVVNGDQDYGITGWSPSKSSDRFIVTGGEIRSWSRPPLGGTDLSLRPGQLDDPGGCAVGRVDKQGALSLNVTFQKSGLSSGYSFDIKGYVCY